MNWNEIGVNTAREAVDAISHKFHEMNASGVAIEDPLDMTKERDTFFGEIYELNPDHYPQKGVNVKGYFPQDYTIVPLKHQLQVFLDDISAYLDTGTGQITVKEMDETDWATAWKAYYKPVCVTSDITIVPTWEAYQPDEQEKILELDPGMAFGTGAHPTTILCIQALEHYVQPDQTVIDVGCGSGVLSIASILSGACFVYALDLDEVAVSSTRTNAGLNDMQDHIQVQQGDLLETADQQADVMVSNILAETIIDLIDDAKRVLRTGGTFITSGIITSKQDMVVNGLTEAGFVIQSIEKRDGWVLICAQKSDIQK